MVVKADASANTDSVGQICNAHRNGVTPSEVRNDSTNTVPATDDGLTPALELTELHDGVNLVPAIGQICVIDQDSLASAELQDDSTDTAPATDVSLSPALEHNEIQHGIDPVPIIGQICGQEQDSFTSAEIQDDSIKAPRASEVECGVDSLPAVGQVYGIRRDGQLDVVWVDGSRTSTYLHQCYLITDEVCMHGTRNQCDLCIVAVFNIVCK